MIKQRLSDIYAHKILSIIRDNPGIPRAALQKHTGVRMPTIITILSGLMKKGLILEGKSDEPHLTKGRRSYRLSLNGAFRSSIGIDIMGDVHCALVGFDGTLQKSESIENGPELKDRLAQTVRSFIKETSLARLEGIAVSFPGFADASGHIHFSSAIRGLSSFDFLAHIADENDVRFSIENPPAAIAMEEARLHPDGAFVVVELDEGVGGCIVNNGALYTTDTKREGEIGHLTVPGFDTPCGCGSTGCVESVLRPGAIVDGMKSIVARNTDTLLYYLVKKDIEKIDFELIARASEEGDEVVNKYLRERFAALSVLLRSVILMVNPDRIILTGRLTQLRTMLASVIDMFRKINSNAVLPSLRECPIEVKPYDPTERARLSALSLFGAYFK